MTPESEHILDYLVGERLREPNPHYAADIAISAKTVSLAASGCPRPHHVATLMILGITPSQVWPKIVAARKAKLGKLYSKFYFLATDLPRPDFPSGKPPQSERQTYQLMPTARKLKP